MTKYAVIRLGGHQFKVSEKEEFLVDRLVGEASAEVLLVSDGDKVSIGKPRVNGAKVSLKKLEDLRGEKVDVYKYKAKSRYRKKIGFRPAITKLQVVKISA